MAGIHEERDTKSLTLGALFVQRNMEQLLGAGDVANMELQATGRSKNATWGNIEVGMGARSTGNRGSSFTVFVRRRATGTDT